MDRTTRWYEAGKCMNNLNSVLLEGNLVKDPEKITIGETGRTMARFSLAVNRYYKNGNKEPVEEVMFITIQVWGNLAQGCLTYLQKGRGVRVVGRLRQERWNDKDGGSHERIVVVAEHVEFKPEKTGKTPEILQEEGEMDYEDEEISI
ncbi:single-stranded DNA-binding protein [uncultured Sphaerochaeta sp.]|uniref:single-stranded DNA-binding protein n=1 Tax=uncultured Sphaerochaeta sp. TaxID=886478 RepID=UPI002A0A9CB2|nr:single-stranded DNA-binding protein [uncultured Sphaerochaeta sp.]